MRATMPRRAALGAIVAAADMVARASRAEDANLAVIGDSLTYGWRLQAPAQLGAVGGSQVRIDGQGSRRIPEAAPAPYSGVKALRSLRASGFDPAALVIELGTNDVGYAARHGQDLRVVVQEMLDAVGAGPRG